MQIFLHLSVAGLPLSGRTEIQEGVVGKEWKIPESSGRSQKFLAGALELQFWFWPLGSSIYIDYISYII